jgi:hypothetical protein
MDKGLTIFFLLFHKLDLGVYILELFPWKPDKGGRATLLPSNSAFVETALDSYIVASEMEVLFMNLQIPGWNSCFQTSPKVITLVIGHVPCTSSRSYA